MLDLLAKRRQKAGDDCCINTTGWELVVFTFGEKKFKKPDTAAMQRVLKRNSGMVAEIILQFAWLCGLSVSEMLSVKWSDISWEKGEISLPDRKVPITEEVRNSLQNRRKRATSKKSEHMLSLLL